MARYKKTDAADADRRLEKVTIEGFAFLDFDPAESESFRLRFSILGRVLLE
ncbi:MAG TPA: hypothetical protein VMV10_32925 [Pirellulales bacterium]|nr:hypothetical protein [Pirellulales bacterium]